MSELATENRRLTEDRVREIFREELAAPTYLPPEFKAWLPNIIEVTGLQIPRGDVIGLYAAADASTEFGERIHGRPVVLRVGSSPFEFIQFQYDSTYGKWVSAQTWSTYQTAQVNIVSTSYADVGISSWSPFFIPNFKSLYDAGARPQLTSGGKFQCSASNTVFLRANLYQVAHGDTALASIGTAAETTSTDTTLTYRFYTGWDQPSLSAPSDAHLYIVPQTKSQNTPSSDVLSTGGYMHLRFVVD